MSNLVKTSLRGWYDGFPLLMIDRREKQKLRMFDAEAVAPFGKAALAQDENLFAPPECIDNHGPLFERRSHQLILGGRAAIGNADTWDRTCIERSRDSFVASRLHCKALSPTYPCLD